MSSADWYLVVRWRIGRAKLFFWRRGRPKGMFASAMVVLWSLNNIVDRCDGYCSCSLVETKYNRPLVLSA